MLTTCSRIPFLFSVSCFRTAERLGVEYLIDILRLALPREYQVLDNLLKFDKNRGVLREAWIAFSLRSAFPGVVHLSLRLSPSDREAVLSPSPTTGYIIAENLQPFHCDHYIWELIHHLPNLESVEFAGATSETRGEGTVQPFYPVAGYVLSAYTDVSRGLFPHLRRLSLANIDFSSVVWLIDNLQYNVPLEALALHNVFGQSNSPLGESTGEGQFDYHVMHDRGSRVSPHLVDIQMTTAPHQAVSESRLSHFFGILFDSHRKALATTPGPHPAPVASGSKSLFGRNGPLPSSSKKWQGKRQKTGHDSGHFLQTLQHRVKANRKGADDTDEDEESDGLYDDTIDDYLDILPSKRSMVAPQADGPLFSGKITVGRNIIDEYHLVWAAICSAVDPRVPSRPVQAPAKVKKRKGTSAPIADQEPTPALNPAPRLGPNYVHPPTITLVDKANI